MGNCWLASRAFSEFWVTGRRTTSIYTILAFFFFIQRGVYTPIAPRRKLHQLRMRSTLIPFSLTTCDHSRYAYQSKMSTKTSRREYRRYGVDFRLIYFGLCSALWAFGRLDLTGAHVFGRVSLGYGLGPYMRRNRWEITKRMVSELRRFLAKFPGFLGLRRNRGTWYSCRHDTSHIPMSSVELREEK